MFFRIIDGVELSYPIPTNRRPVLKQYVRGIRRRFQLLPEDGVSDDDFYGD